MGLKPRRRGGEEEEGGEFIRNLRHEALLPRQREEDALGRPDGCVENQRVADEAGESGMLVVGVGLEWSGMVHSTYEWSKPTNTCTRPVKISN